MALRKYIQSCEPKFQLKCPLLWESLQTTQNPEIRFCETCERNVHFCITLEQAISLGKSGHCVALLAANPLAISVPARTQPQGDLMQTDPQVARLVPKEIALKYNLLAVRREGTVLIVASDGPLSQVARDDLMFLTGLHIEGVQASRDDIRAAIDALLSESECEMGVIDDNAWVEETPNDSTVVDDAPIVRLCDVILQQAYKRSVSRLSLECDLDSFRVLFEENGQVHEEMRPPRKLFRIMISRLFQISTHSTETTGSAFGVGHTNVAGSVRTLAVSSRAGGCRFKVEWSEGEPLSRLTLTRIVDLYRAGGLVFDEGVAPCPRCLVDLGCLRFFLSGAGMGHVPFALLSCLCAWFVLRVASVLSRRLRRTSR